MYKKISFLIIINLILYFLFSINVYAIDEDLKKEKLSELKEMGRENFEENLRNTFPELFETGIFYDQGYNYFLFENTCGQSISASAMNILFYTTKYSENEFVVQSVDNNLCDVKVIYEEKRGSQTAKQLISTIEQITYKTKDFVDIDCIKLNNFPTIEEMNKFLDNKGLIILNASSNILWFDKEGEIDHFILLLNSVKNTKGKIVGFNIVDSSGSNIDFIDIEKLNNCIYGYKDTPFNDNEMILIKKKIFIYNYFDENILTKYKFRIVENKRNYYENFLKN